MKVVITIDDIRAYTEVNYIINHMNQKYIEMIPKKLLEFFSDFSDPNYSVKIDPRIPLENQGLQHYTLEILAVLHLKYWCQDEERKQELYNLMIDNNEEKLNDHLKYRESIEGLFEFKDDDEKEEVDYSTPRVIEKYDIPTKENDNIEEPNDVLNANENLPLENEVVKTKGFFAKIKEKILSLFRK